jgi:hypothetical protein
MLLDLSDMPPGFGNNPRTEQRCIAIGHGAAVPFAALEIVDDGKVIWVLREYYVDPARETEPRTDSAYAEDVGTFLDGADPLHPDSAPVPRGRRTDAHVLVRRHLDTAHFQLEAQSRGMFVFSVEDVALKGIEQVGSLFEKKLVKVARTCPRFIEEHRSFGWNRQKQAQGLQEPNATNAQTVEAFRLFALHFGDQWRWR